MSNPEHMEQLERGVGSWNRWRLEHDGVVDLSGADLRWKSLSGANLSSVVLSNANLSHSELGHVDMRWSRLDGVNLTNARLVSTDFGIADLYGARFGSTWIKHCSFAGTSLKDATGLEHCWHMGFSLLDYTAILRSWPVPTPFLRGCGLPEEFVKHLPGMLNLAADHYSCFISYSREDQEFARKLYHRLQERGIQCWFDEERLLPGDDLYHQIENGIRHWDKTILCCSKSSLSKSWWFDNEMDAALEKERRLKREKGNIRTLIPLDLDGYLFSSNDDNNSKERLIKSRFVGDFVGWESDESKFERQIDRLIRALKTEESGREPAPAPKM